MFRPVVEKGYGYRYPQRYGLRRVAFTPIYQMKHYHAIRLPDLTARHGWKAQKPICSIRLSSLHAMAQSGKPLLSASVANMAHNKRYASGWQAYEHENSIAPVHVPCLGLSGIDFFL
jgi:hypothetical protein